MPVPNRVKERYKKKSLKLYMFNHLIFFLFSDVKRGVPGERLRQFVERKLKDPSSRAKPLVFQDHPLNFIKGGSLNNPVDVILFNEEIVSTFCDSKLHIVLYNIFLGMQYKHFKPFFSFFRLNARSCIY